MKTKTVPPYAPTLIEATRAIGYTLEAAVADIVDNCISAFASCVEVFFFPVGDSYIAILDDGCGMNEEEIEKAMRYGSQSPNEKRAPDDLGRFGLGLKTASLSQCRILTVVSKQKNSIEARRWDVDHVVKVHDWSLLILDSEEELNGIPRINELRQLKSGTLVVWQNLDRLMIGESDLSRFMGKKMNDVRSHLSLVFHRYINGEPGIKRLRIKMNNTPVEPADPFLAKRNTQVIAEEILYINGSRVSVRPYILPHVSSMTSDEINALGGKEGLRKRQGFYVYRNKRLLVWGTWFRMMQKTDLSKLARVQVDIKKSTAIPPEEVRSNLGSVIERLAEYSKRTWVFRGKKERRDSVVHIWKRFNARQGGAYYEINRNHPLVEVFEDSSSQIKKNLENLLKEIERGLPLSSLYVDLTTDTPVEPKTEITEQEVEKLLLSLLGQRPTDTPKANVDYLDRLGFSEPFINFSQLLEKYRTGGNVND